MGENTYIDVVEYINCGGKTHNSLAEESSCPAINKSSLSIKMKPHDHQDCGCTSREDQQYVERKLKCHSPYPSSISFRIQGM